MKRPILHLVIAASFAMVLSGCSTPSPPPPTGGDLADYAVCAIHDQEGKPKDCPKPPIELQVQGSLEGQWLCAVPLNSAGHDGLSIYYNPLSGTNALWFNWSREDARVNESFMPLPWFGAFYMEGDFYNLTSPGSTGYAVLPKALPDGALRYAFSKTLVRSSGALGQEPAHDILWLHNDDSSLGVVHRLNVEDADYWFFNENPTESVRSFTAAGADFTVTFYMDNTGGANSDGVRPTIPLGGIMGTPRDECQ